MVNKFNIGDRVWFRKLEDSYSSAIVESVLITKARIVYYLESKPETFVTEDLCFATEQEVKQDIKNEKIEKIFILMRKYDISIEDLTEVEKDLCGWEGK